MKDGKDRFLFEMATGTGKTLTAAAVIKLFLRTGNASRVLFLVDRLELEDQAEQGVRRFSAQRLQDGHLQGKPRRLAPRGNRRHHRAVVAVQQQIPQLFSPTDFDLVISDEAHRSIGGNARAVFEYFIGYKLGLTATPRDYLKRFDEDQSTSTTRAKPSAGCCSTPTAPSAARTASQLSAIRCSTGSRTAS